MNWQNSKTTLALLCGIVLALVLAVVPAGLVGAAKDVVLPVPPVEQRFKPPEPAGGRSDSGKVNCLPASVAMTLQTLEKEGKLSGSATDYPTIRRAFRRVVTNPADGIGVRVAEMLVPSLTNNAVKPTELVTDTTHWQSAIERELSAGYPVIAIIPDWTLLAGPSRAKVPFAHAVTIAGLKNGNVLYNDPWDGVQYSMPIKDFGKAWALKWPDGVVFGGLTFSPNSQSPKTSTPEEVLAESITAMRKLPLLAIETESSLMGLGASGKLTIARPGSLDGKGSLAGVTWSVATANGYADFRVQGQAIGVVPASDAVAATLDSLVALPSYASDWKQRQEEDHLWLEGQLSTDALEDAVRRLGAEIPGKPHARLLLDVDPASKVWRELRVVLSWPFVQSTVLGRKIEFGPSGSVGLKFQVEWN